MSKRVQSMRTPAWVHLSDEALLKLRFCDLHLNLNSPFIRQHLDKLYAELAQRKLKFKPHVWLSEEWFSPDGIPGFAIPFYLAHPRLMQLERNLMREVEGGNTRWLMRILRHETGHAIDTAFRLRRRKAWRQVFGSPSRRYPTSYRPRPASQKFVLHLGHWYAQSHPTEDFAETFAVWLQPKSRWRHEYCDWPAHKKLQFVHDTMRALIAIKPTIDTAQVVYPLDENRRTLAAHYRQKQQHHALEPQHLYDAKLLRVFKQHEKFPQHPRASSFLRQVKPQLLRLLTRRTRLHAYLIHQVARMLIQRCRTLNLVVTDPPTTAKRKALTLMEHIITDTLRRNREHHVL